MVKFSCDRKELVDALAITQSAVPAKSTLAILGNMQFVADGDRLEITGTNIDLWARTKIAAAVETGGAVTLPARRFGEIARHLDADDVEVAVEGTQATVRGGRATFKLMGLDASDYPVFPEVKAEHALTLTQGTLKNLIKKTLFAASEDVTRYALNGVCIQAEGNEVRFVATDGYRLALTSLKTEIEIGGIVDVILPSKAASELSKVLGDDDPAEISFGESHISFECGGFHFVTRQAEGKFPPYREVIPQSFEKEVRISRGPFLDVIDRVALMCDENNRQVIISFRPEQLEVEVKTAEIGEAREPLPCIYGGEEFKVSYNPAFLREIIASLEGDDIIYEVNDPAKQGSFRGTGDENHFCILMPIKI
jgi:DNA polymerase-3 subunit beta